MKLTSNFQPQTSNNVLLSIISGILLALSFPKFDLWWLAWVALAPFFLALNRSRSSREAAFNGLIFGIVFFGINLFWVTSLFRFAGWWIVPGWLCLVIFQTMYVLLFAFACFRFRNQFPISNFQFPIFWTAIEYLRSLGPFGVTAGDLGYTQAHFLPIIQIASIFQVYGVSFLVALVNYSIAIRRGFLISLFIFMLAIGYGFYTLRGNREVPTSTSSSRDPDSHIGIHSPVSELPKLALIQPNIDQFDKMNPAKVQEVFAVHENLTRAAARSKPEIIIWPETAVFTYLLRDPVFLPRVQQLARETNAYLLIGTPHFDEPGKVYNSMVSISPSGEIVSRYDKERLVPFGEYLPFSRLLYPLLKGTGYFEQDFAGNPAVKPITAGKHNIAGAICFESTFPDIIRRRVKNDSAFILTITNDAWFDVSSAPYFHLNAGVFRAIENRKYFVQVGNSGFSAVIDPYGRIIKKSRLNERGFLLTAW